MNRSVSERNILDKFCLDFCSVIEKYARYIIVSGFVAIASGRTRGTEDIDMIVERLPKEVFLRAHDALVKKGFVAVQSDNPEELYSYLIENLSVRYTYKNIPVPDMEVKFAKDALDEYQLKTRIKLPRTKLDVWFSSVNMNIAFKEGYLKSEKDLEDAQHLRIVYSDMIDEKEINRIKQMIKRLRL